MSQPVHPDAPAAPLPRRGPVRRYLEVRGLVGRHEAPNAPVRLVADDGVRLAGTFLPGPDAGAPAVVLLHGFAAHCRKPAYARLADELSQRFHVLAMDLRGHGASSGETTFGDREVLDARAAVGWLRQQGHDWVGVVGVSMGGTTAMHAAGTGLELDAVVAISAPAVIRHEPDTEPMRRLKTIWETPLSRHGMRYVLGVRLIHPLGWQAPPHPRDMAASVKAPLLVVHGADDAYFPPTDAEQIAGAAPRSVLWLEPPGFGHAEDGLTPAFCRRLTGAIATAVTDGTFPDRNGSI